MQYFFSWTVAPNWALAGPFGQGLALVVLHVCRAFSPLCLCGGCSLCLENPSFHCSKPQTEWLPAVGLWLLPSPADPAHPWLLVNDPFSFSDFHPPTFPTEPRDQETLPPLSCHPGGLQPGTQYSHWWLHSLSHQVECAEYSLCSRCWGHGDGQSSLTCPHGACRLMGEAGINQILPPPSIYAQWGWGLQKGAASLTETDLIDPGRLPGAGEVRSESAGGAEG